MEIANTMPKSLCMVMIPRSDTWPASFKSSPPTEHSIALFFFSKGRDEEVLDKLMTHAINTDSALKSMIGDAELLIFTSLQLPQNLHRLEGKPYFWGVLRGPPSTASHQSGYHARIQTIRARKSLSPRKSFNFDGALVAFSSNNSPFSQACKADRRGRSLDDGWQHAKPLDILRQKAECRYCGFVSSHGGISRLKAHLGGGNPGTRLPACNKVPPEVKRVMAEWFSEGVKNTKALWTKKIRESAGYSDKRGWPPDVTREFANPVDAQQTYGECIAADEKPERRGRPLDDAWGHAKALDDARQKTSRNYCGFVSTYGGISRLKAHLGGGSPQMQLQGCSQVPLQVKTVMEKWFDGWSKTSAAAWTRNSHATPGRPSKRGRPDDAWEHAIPLDEMGEATRCKYCGFVSKYGGIARLKAHLSGVNLTTMQLECCPNVSPEIRNSMDGFKKKDGKQPKDEPLETFEGTQKCSDKQRFILQGTMDEISSASVKGRLKRLIEEKNADVEKMQFEVSLLQRHLASMP